MMKNWVFTVWVFLIVKWKKVLSVFCVDKVESPFEIQKFVREVRAGD